MQLLHEKSKPSAMLEVIMQNLKTDTELQLSFMKLIPAEYLDVMRPYKDGMSLYAAHFAPNRLDPSGKAISCVGGGAYLAVILGFSGSVQICSDDCGSKGAIITCGGVGLGGGGGIGGGVGVSQGCLDPPGWQCSRVHLQANLGPIGVDGIYDTGDGDIGGAIEPGIGVGGVATHEACYRFN